MVVRALMMKKMICWEILDDFVCSTTKMKSSVFGFPFRRARLRLRAAYCISDLHFSSAVLYSTTIATPSKPTAICTTYAFAFALKYDKWAYCSHIECKRKNSPNQLIIISAILIIKSFFTLRPLYSHTHTEDTYYWRRSRIKFYIIESTTDAIHLRLIRFGFVSLER